MSTGDLAVESPRRLRCALISCFWLSLAGGEFAYAVERHTSHTVVIEALQFAPSPVYAKVGDTVIWINKDPFPHTATAPGQFDSGAIASGRSWRFRLRAKGRYEYICTLHPNMKGAIVVE